MNPDDLSELIIRDLGGSKTIVQGGSTYGSSIKVELMTSQSQRIVINVSKVEGIALIDHFNCIIPFQLSLFAPQPISALETNMTSTIEGSPFLIYSDPRYLNALKSLAPWWSSICSGFAVFEKYGKAVFLSDRQCWFAFDMEHAQALGFDLRQLSKRLAKLPFHPISSVELSTRYADQIDVRLDPGNVPRLLQEYLPLAAFWSISNEEELSTFAARIEPNTIAYFLRVFKEYEDEITSFCGVSDQVEVPDEIVVFQIASHAYAILRTC